MQGKARKAAKAAKAREEEEAEERNMNNNQPPNGQQQQQVLDVQRSNMGNTTQCRHGIFDGISFQVICFDFSHAYMVAFDEGTKSETYISDILIRAHAATLNEFAVVWKDYAKMEMAMSFLLRVGTRMILEGDNNRATLYATVTQYFEQHIAVNLHKIQAIMNWVKIVEAYNADEHTLVKFFRTRIPCTCLDEKYEEVKHIKKMGICFNPKCNIRDGKVQRSKTMFCSRCREITYCSRECQEADWKRHKKNCDVAKKAKFEAELQT